ncbi:alpha/beta fold hydrolase [Aquihabitans daechungensis]|uniref:alpha/beta fold hydrolase n=1 Tax=Aquihabitans daechungensis TaxID=1052257 RepID=UPI003B9F846F
MPALEKRSITIHGHEVAYRFGGPEVAEGAPVLLLIHGMAGSSATWREVGSALAKEYTVVAPDLLGHGASAKPRHDYSLGAFAGGLRDLLVALRIDRATIVGQSLGGGIAMQFAYQHPERCERLVLVNSGGLGPDVSWILRALTLPGVEYVMPVLFPSFIRDAGDAVRRKLGSFGLRAPHVEEEWRGYASLTDPETRQAFVKTLRAVIDLSGQSVSAHDRLYLAELLPTLIVWGERDKIIPVSHAHDAHAAMPGSELVVFEHSGHFPHVEEPQRFAEVLLAFLEANPAVRLDPSEWQERLVGGRPAA